MMPMKFANNAKTLWNHHINRRFFADEADGAGGGAAGGGEGTTVSYEGMFDKEGNCTEAFTKALPAMLGDAFYNDPATKQQPTKLFEQVKNIKTFAVNYLNSQRALCKRLEGMVKIPGEGAPAEEVAAYRKAMGVPDSEDGYVLNIPEGPAKAANETLAKGIKGAALAANLPAKVVSAIWDQTLAAAKKIAEARDEDDEKKGRQLMEAEQQALKDELKEKYEPFMKANETALGVTKNGAAFKQILTDLTIFGHPAIQKFLGEIAPLLVEGKTILGDGGNPAPKLAEGGVGLDYSKDVEHHKQET